MWTEQITSIYSICEWIVAHKCAHPFDAFAGIIVSNEITHRSIKNLRGERNYRFLISNHLLNGSVFRADFKVISDWNVFSSDLYRIENFWFTSKLNNSRKILNLYNTMQNLNVKHASVSAIFHVYLFSYFNSNESIRDIGKNDSEKLLPRNVEFRILPKTI